MPFRHPNDRDRKPHSDYTMKDGQKVPKVGSFPKKMTLSLTLEGKESVHFDMDVRAASDMLEHVRHVVKTNANHVKDADADTIHRVLGVMREDAKIAAAKMK